MMSSKHLDGATPLASAGGALVGAALQASGVTTRLGGQDILRALDLSLPQGRWTAVVGPNGAGKTTLLRTLAGLLPCVGRVQLMGRELDQWSRRERARALAWLGQSEAGPLDLSAADVVMLGRLPHQGWWGEPGPADRQAVQQAMEQTQCWAWRARGLASLSGGERQRVLLARALAVQARVLLMDEPLTGLDAPHQADWLAVVREQVAAGCTVVTVLHELTMALHADDLVVMRDGRILHHGTSTDAATHAALLQVFDQRIRLLAIDGQWVALPARPADTSGATETVAELGRVA